MASESFCIAVAPKAWFAVPSPAPTPAPSLLNSPRSLHRRLYNALSDAHCESKTPTIAVPLPNFGAQLIVDLELESERTIRVNLDFESEEFRRDGDVVNALQGSDCVVIIAKTVARRERDENRFACGSEAQERGEGSGDGEVV